MIYPHLYYFHQFVKNEAWRPASGVDLFEIVAGDVMPRYHTVLGMESEYDENVPPKYYGPLYFDIDVAGDIAKAIQSTLLLIDKLIALGVNPESLWIYCSGGKGFHIEVDPAAFNLTAPIARLPAIYKLLAQDLFVDGLDMVVYSERKGRMWRIENATRENTCYKVRITYNELQGLTCDSYIELTSKPRFNVPLPLEAKLSAPLLALFNQAKTRVNAASSTPVKSGELAKRFKGKLPPTVLALCAGKLDSPVGWNRIAVQLALAAHECGVDEDGLIATCKGLIDRHKGDGKRYDSPRAREDELRRMFEYVASSSSYEFTIAGLRSILPPGMPCPDFRGLK